VRREEVSNFAVGAADLIHVTGTRTPARSKTVRTFDFRRPSKLNRDHVRTLEIVQEIFSRQFSTVLSSTLRAVASVQVESIEQVSYDEYIRATPNPTHLNLLSVAPLPGLAVFQIPLEISFAAVDLLLGGHGKQSHRGRPLSEIEQNLLRGLVGRILAELRYAFESVVELDPTVTQIESNPQFAQIAGPSDMIAVVSFEVRINQTVGKATLAIPYASLSPVLDSFTGNVVFAERDDKQVVAAQQSMQHHLNESDIEVGLRFDNIRLSSSELIGLRPGDVLPLYQSVDSTLTVTLAGKPAFVAKPARRGKRLAAQIMAPLGEF
jgi:flagellar motor switch protein FliM